jgi:hypothetical protein
MATCSFPSSFRLRKAPTQVEKQAENSARVGDLNENTGEKSFSI